MIAYRTGGIEALADHRSRPDRVWNRIPETIRAEIVELALRETELSPRELAVRFTDEKSYFVSEASVYRLLKAHDLITKPGLHRHQGGVRVQGQDHGAQPALADRLHLPEDNRLGWYYLSTVLDDFSRYIVAWKLCATMRADDVTATLDLALAAAGLDQITVAHRPRLLSDNGSSYISADLAAWLDGKAMQHVRGAPYHPQTQG